MKKKTPIKNSLRRHRMALNYSQRDVSEILEFKRTNRISSWEHGRAMPSADNLLRLSILYRTLPAELYITKYKALREKIAQSEKAFHADPRNQATCYDDS